ncbi:unnamed protein product [Cuscuta epithymum]|uniref:Uncharacterized protein n=1 Tax=Cuscuta epithymum TaxID=186058 RepID=A0AAV0CJ40_9ASTE|nr:unnamed protein product [Cuscuta epithymum]
MVKLIITNILKLIFEKIIYQHTWLRDKVIFISIFLKLMEYIILLLCRAEVAPSFCSGSEGNESRIQPVEGSYNGEKLHQSSTFNSVVYMEEGNYSSSYRFCSKQGACQGSEL